MKRHKKERKPGKVSITVKDERRFKADDIILIFCKGEVIKTNGYTYTFNSQADAKRFMYALNK